MSDKHPCESCSMPIETGRYCQYCVNEKGELQPFEERFERMVSWQARKSPGKSREALEAGRPTGHEFHRRAGRPVQ